MQQQEQLPQNQQYSASSAPVGQLFTKRSLAKYILFGIITFGIHGIVFWYGISDDLNTIARRYDGKKTMNYALLVFLIAPLTFFVGFFVWFHKMTGRMGRELQRRNINYSISSADFWLWYVLGSLILVGPFIYAHKMAKASNQLALHYNTNG